MTTLNAERLYALLPAIYRLRDAQQAATEQERPLRSLIQAIAQELAALEENIEQLYDDQFIETCAEWVAPYIGELIGYRPLQALAVDRRRRAPRWPTPSRYRRRKGTALMLEQLARDVTDMAGARAVEFFEQLATTQYMKHIRACTRRRRPTCATHVACSSWGDRSIGSRTLRICGGPRRREGATTFPTSGSSSTA